MSLCVLARCRVNGDGFALPGREAGTAYICEICVERLREDLRAVPALLALLEQALLKHIKPASIDDPASWHHTKDQPELGTHIQALPFSEQVSTAWRELEAFVAGWSRVVAEDRGIAWPPTPLLADCSPWLQRHLEWLAHQPFAGDAFNELRDAFRGAHRAIEPEPAPIALGPCPGELPDGTPCEQPLQVRPGANRITCHGCGRTWPDREWSWLAQLLGVTQAGLVDAYDASTALANLGLGVSPTLIRKWAQRRAVGVRGTTTPGGRSLYDLGELIRLATLRAASSHARQRSGH